MNLTLDKMKQHLSFKDVAFKMELVPLSETYDAETLAMIAESEDLVHASKVSVMKSRKYTEDIQQIGGNTLDKLYHQGQQLEAIAGQVESINDDVREGERQLTSIESVFGALRNKFIGRRKKSKGGKKKKGEKEKGEKEKGEKEKGEKEKGEKDKSKKDPTGSPLTSAAMMKSDPRMFDHLSAGTRDDLCEIDDHLDAIQNNLDVIGTMAKDMGREITHHNQQLKRLSPAVTKTTERIQKASDRTQRQI